MEDTGIRTLFLIAIVLALPIVPLLVWGEMFTGLLDIWGTDPPSQLVLALGVVAILAADIVLPVPSGPVSTLAGVRLGLLFGTMACWLGMTTGAVAAFWLVRRWGRAAALWFAKPGDLDRLQEECGAQDVWMLLVTRPLPVLAEACVLLLGLTGTPWKRFLPVVAVSNLIIALIYCLLGHYAAEQTWLPLAVYLSIVAPVSIGLWARWRFWKS